MSDWVDFVGIMFVGYCVFRSVEYVIMGIREYYKAKKQKADVISG